MSSRVIPLSEFARDGVAPIGDEEESLLSRVPAPSGDTMFWGGIALSVLLLAVLGTILGLSVATFLNSEKIHGPGHYETCSIERSVDGSLDDRCPPCEQANMQQKLNEFVAWEIEQQNLLYGTYACSGTRGALGFVDAPQNQDPLFPDEFDKLMHRIYERSKGIDMDLLDPYDAINFNETFRRKKFYQWAQNTSAEVEICERRFEDWHLPSVAIFPALEMFSQIDETTPILPTSYGAWVLDSTLFYYYVGQIEMAIAAVEARIDGDWWTAVYERIQSNNGVLCADFVASHLNVIAYEILWTDPLSMPQPIRYYLAQRGYTMTPAEDAYLDDVLTRYSAAQQRFLNYSLAVTPALVTSISLTDWMLNYGWTDCFGYTNGLWYYNMNADDLRAMFDDFKLEAETLAAQLLVQRDALWPDDAWLPWQDTWLHYVFPVGYPNPLNISGWAFDPVECVVDPLTGEIPFGATLSMSAYRYYNDRYKLYSAANGQTSEYMPTLKYGGCGPLDGNAYSMVLSAPRSENWVTPSVIGAQGPMFTANLTYSVLIHEMKHAAHTGMIMATACPTCFSVFQTVRAVRSGCKSIADLYAIPGNEWLTYLEGSAADAELQSLVVGMQTEWEEFHAQMFRQLTRLTGVVATFGVRLGEWDPAGAMAWIAQTSWFPPGFSASTLYQRAIRDMTGSAGWYGVGIWKIQVARQRAQERCGSNFNEQTFNTLTHSLPISVISAWDQLLEDYITAGCVSPTTRFGDARRTVVAPSLQ